MAPVKFDDLPKTATSLLSDDFHTSGFVLKTKQKTSWTGAVLSSQVDVAPGAKVATPAKLTWKLPRPMGFDHFVVDKLEMDKAGRFKLEASTDKVHPALKVECKSNLVDPGNVVVGCTYTGVQDAQAKFECKPANPQDFTGEVTYCAGLATAGLKFNGSILSGGLPDLGVRYARGPLFLSLLAKDGMNSLSAGAHYKACPDCDCAATYDHNMKKGTGNLTVGAVCKGQYRLKLCQDQSISFSVKRDVAKGFTLLGGVKYSAGSQDLSYGVQLNVE